MLIVSLLTGPVGSSQYRLACRVHGAPARSATLFCCVLLVSVCAGTTVATIARHTTAWHSTARVSFTPVAVAKSHNTTFYALRAAAH
jgi:hypothetical protein